MKDKYLESIRAVTAADLQRVAGATSRPTRRTSASCSRARDAACG